MASGDRASRGANGASIRLNPLLDAIDPPSLRNRDSSGTHRSQSNYGQHRLRPPPHIVTAMYYGLSFFVVSHPVCILGFSEARTWP